MKPSGNSVDCRHKAPDVARLLQLTVLNPVTYHHEKSFGRLKGPPRCFLLSRITICSSQSFSDW